MPISCIEIRKFESARLGVAKCCSDASIWLDLHLAEGQPISIIGSLLCPENGIDFRNGRITPQRLAATDMDHLACNKARLFARQP